MLVLGRVANDHNRDSIIITCPNGDVIRVVLVRVASETQARIGIAAPKSYAIVRSELKTVELGNTAKHVAASDGDELIQACRDMDANNGKGA